MNEQPPQSNEKGEPKLQPAQKVKVQRSNGEIEYGWIIVSFNEETDKYSLLKEDSGIPEHTKTKGVLRKELEALNEAPE